MTEGPFEIFVFCDDASHSPKRQPIATFVELPRGWHEQAPKNRKGRAGHVGTGMHMIGDAPAASGWANDPDIANAEVRTRHELVCERTPTCRRRAVPARQERLFSVLNDWRAAGVSELALAVLAASMGEQVERSLD